MIHFDKVIFSYPGHDKALDNLSLKIRPGEQVAVVGGNGSGKTTLMLLIDGILKPSQGKVRVFNLDPCREEQANIIHRKVGIVFQDPDNQLVSTTVEREVAFSLENMNIQHPDLGDRVESIIERLELQKLRKKLTSELSGGEKQRLALAAVMVTEPEVLILDEPGSFLDENGKNALKTTVDELKKQNPELIIIRVTQYARVAKTYDRLLVLNNGKIVADGKPSDIYSGISDCHSWGIDIPLEYRIKYSLPEMIQDNSVGDESHTQADIAENQIIFDNVSFGYEPGEIILGNINTKFTTGHIYGIVGASGCGKSTFLQLAAGLLKPVHGGVYCDGFVGTPGKIAISFQQAERQFFLDTVDREMRFGASNLSLESIDKVIDESYRAVDLDKCLFAARDPFTLSGGEQRRLAFGTILTMSPKFVLFDEPTCALDANGIALFKKLIYKLKNDGKGVLIVSHDGNLLLELVDKIFVVGSDNMAESMDSQSFFSTVSYDSYLSVPDIIRYQIERYQKVTYYSEHALLQNL